MKTDEAFEILRRMQEPEAWEPQISEKAFDALEMAIDALALMRWIPVAERLPKKCGVYLVTKVYGARPVVGVEGFYDERNDIEDKNFVWKKYVKAWMPLPKPYKEEKKK